MESLRELFRIGFGPSSSHTMGPRYAVERFISSHPDARKVEVTLYGSLATTGKGHLTDKAISEAFSAHDIECNITWHPEIVKSFHPNALTILETYPDTLSETYYSVGGGKVVREGDENKDIHNPYQDELVGSMEKLLSYCDENGLQFWEVAIEAEGNDILEYMRQVWTVMKDAIKRGIEAEGVLPGGLHLQRKACQSYAKSRDFSGSMGNASNAFAYALAVSEENAGGGLIVTAPTCGSCGVLPSVLFHLMKEYEVPEIRILRALLTAGMIGNIVKTNGSISGAEAGCQAEVGVACAMAGGAAAQIMGGTIRQVEYAAEMGLEHHLGLTCDPLMGLVQIPCIERNALAAMRAIDHATYALMGDGMHKISFDDVVSVMVETGHALPSLYRETSQGGLAGIQEFNSKE